MKSTEGNEATGPGEPPAAPQDGRRDPGADAAVEPIPVSAPPSLDGTEASAAAGNPWGAITRSALIAALIGVGAVVWAQTTFQARWVTRFIVHNKLDMAQRMTLIKSMLGGAAILVVVFLVGALIARRKGASTRSIERFMWFISPLAFLPALPLLFRYKTWDDRYPELLVTLVIFIVAFEGTLRRSLTAVSGRLERAWCWLIERIPRVVKAHGPLTVVVLGVVGYAVFFSFYAVRWHYKLQTHNLELSVINNLMYGALRGEFMKSTVLMGPDGPSYLAASAELGHYLFLPIYAIFPRPETLIVIESCLLGLTALPLFFFAKKRLSGWASAFVSLCFLAYYPMHGANFYEVKLEAIAAVFVVTAIWAVESKRWAVVAASVVAALSMHQNVAVGLFVAGAALSLSGHRPRAGIAIAGVSAAYFLLMRGWIMPRMGDWSGSALYRDFWASGQKGDAGAIKTVVTNPFFVTAKLVDPNKLFYVLHLLVPVALLPLRRPYLWAALVPGFVLTVLTTDHEPAVTHSFHHVMHWAPYLFLATVIALAAIAREPSGRTKQRAALAAMVAASAILTFNWGAFPRRPTVKGGFARIDFRFSKKDAQRYRALREIIALIPPDASVAATDNVGPHVSSRLALYSMRRGSQGAEYVLASQHELKIGRTKPAFVEALTSKSYGVVARRGPFALLKKGQDVTDNDRLLSGWRLRERGGG